MRYRKRIFSTPDNYLHLVSKSQDIKRIEHTEKRIEDNILRKFRQRLTTGWEEDSAGWRLTSEVKSRREGMCTLATNLSGFTRNTRILCQNIRAISVVFLNP